MQVSVLTPCLLNFTAIRASAGSEPSISGGGMVSHGDQYLLSSQREGHNTAHQLLVFISEG